MSPEKQMYRLVRDVDPRHDHVLGDDGAEITLVEYGSYLCDHCHTTHEVVARLRERFGARLRYVYRHLPLADRELATRAAVFAEYAAARTGDFWAVHDVLMQHSPTFADGELDAIAGDLGLPPREQWDKVSAQTATSRVRDDARSGIDSGARLTPTFFINGRRYEGAWDETALSEAMERSLGEIVRTASVNFARWAPSTGLLLLLMTVIAVVASNSSFGPAFLGFWDAPAGFTFGGAGFALTLIDWVNHGLLAVFFLVVGLEIKRELTVGRLATPKAAALPLVAALGGMIVPALIYFLIVPAQFRHAWGMTIATDTAFAVALLVVLGNRVPVELRVFLTAVVIADDLAAILIVALFYTSAISIPWLITSAVITAMLVLLNRVQVYRALPYVLLGVALWFAIHESGLHATLAGVILAAVTPTRPPANVTALMAQAQAIIDVETRLAGAPAQPHRLSANALHDLDAVHDRLSSPANKLLRAMEPWSNFFVLPIFALANAGVVWSTDVLTGRGRLITATIAALVVGKLVGILAGAWGAVRLRIANKPAVYTWRHVAGAGALGGIGFTMSLFIAGAALEGADFGATKLAIFGASLLAGVVGIAILWSAPSAEASITGTFAHSHAPDTNAVD